MKKLRFVNKKKSKLANDAVLATLQRGELSIHFSCDKTQAVALIVFEHKTVLVLNIKSMWYQKLTSSST